MYLCSRDPERRAKTVRFFVALLSSYCTCLSAACEHIISTALCTYICWNKQCKQASFIWTENYPTCLWFYTSFKWSWSRSSSRNYSMWEHHGCWWYTLELWVHKTWMLTFTHCHFLSYDRWNVSDVLHSTHTTQYKLLIQHTANILHFIQLPRPPCMRTQLNGSCFYKIQAGTAAFLTCYVSQ